MTAKERLLRVLLLLSPTILRRGEWVVICRCVAVAAANVRDRLDDYVEVTAKRMSQTGQVWMLNAVLKERFGGGMVMDYVEETGCVIDVYDTAVHTMIGGDATPIIYPLNYGVVQMYDFTVYVPSGCNETEAREVVDACCLPNMRYRVNFYNKTR